MFNRTDKYNDIINLPHHVSKKHSHISSEIRAAQFAPYAALKGYSEAVKETSRETDARIEIDDEVKNIINTQLLKIKQQLLNKPNVTIVYFVPDSRKKGGEYVTVTSNVKKIDDIYGYIVLYNNLKIKIVDILDIKINEKL